MTDSNMTDENPEERPTATELIEILSGDRFEKWYRERQYSENIKNGTPYFNGSGFTPEPHRHSPSKLLQCHRRIVYQQNNTPEEQSDPAGIFWIGRQFEADIAFPFLEDVATEASAYVRNTVWVDFEVETEAGALRIKGATDPLIVDEDAIPIVPTEIKTKSSVEHLSSPNRHHRAQLHAYMVGLSQKYNISLTNGVIVYASRESLNMKIYHVEFDEAFWKDVVLEWADTHTQYRLRDELPPADPEAEWECKFCSYRERCGRGDRHYSDVAVTGLLPQFTGYPSQKLSDYLTAYPSAKLTPSLAFQYPELADEHGVYDWECARCETARTWNTIEWDGDVTAPPRCPDCFAEGSVSFLSGPAPADQVVAGGDNDAA
ncbi:CRISPR-associated protein Cas4 [Halorussus lipolyticus]|uniref:CRISPR-associated protein Cas4 n=1 Tax=Halorussus lipolyticus TaxID=3034024 RepID=UPI0023E823C8|nr:PD-(D/E)XK nuclease family protein [Halorussus sp. DT80]